MTSDGDSLFAAAMDQVARGEEPTHTLAVLLDWLQENLGRHEVVVLRAGERFQAVFYHNGRNFDCTYYSRSERYGDQYQEESGRRHLTLTPTYRELVLQAFCSDLRDTYNHWVKYRRSE